MRFCVLRMGCRDLRGMTDLIFKYFCDACRRPWPVFEEIKKATASRWPFLLLTVNDYCFTPSASKIT